MKSIIGVISIAVMLISCSSVKNEAEVKKVDSLMVLIENAKTELELINPETLREIEDTVVFDVKFIQTEYADTMSLDVAVVVDSYGRMLKSISKFKKTFGEQTSDVKYSSEQLKDMKKDLESGILNKESFDEFYPAEEESVSRLVESNKNLKIWYESISEGFDKRRAPIVQMIKDIQEKKGY